MLHRKKSERKSVDWIEGDQRNAVHLGLRKMEAGEGGGDGGIEVGDTDEKPDAISKMTEEARDEA